MLSEQSSRDKINNLLKSKGWIIDADDPRKNVALEASELEERHKKKLEGKSPDYTLFEGRIMDGKIIGVLEAKNPRINLDKALEQAVRDAKNLGAKFAIVANGYFCKTCHLPTGKPLVIDEEEVQEIISYDNALDFVHKKTNAIHTIPTEIIRDRKELLQVFNRIDDYLWEDNIDAGMPRFMEFANFLFLKLMGEHKKAQFWDKLKGENDKIQYLNQIVILELQKTYGDIFEGTKIKKLHVFDKIFEALDVLHLTSAESDVKGDAFEYFLKHSTATKNDLGQYFTPRHIINAMVHMVSPTIDDTVYDPFCGTGGFLTESFSYIRKQIDTNDKKQFEHLRKNVLFGKDSSQSARIAKMNSILQGDGHSGIQQVKDTLENPVKEEGRYSVGLTNIPFSQNKKNYTYTRLYEGGLARNNGDAICILHLFKAIKRGGRMAAIVPEGFLFRQELAPVRRFLTDNADLKLVVSLPQGVFLPYTGVKTDIIYFENIDCPDKEKHFWYFNVKNDGFTLNNHRRKIKGHNDLDTLKGMNIDEDSEEELLAGGYSKILFEKIRNNHENWIGKQYVEVKKQESEYPLVSLEEICKNFEYGYTDNAKEKGDVRYIRITDIQEDGSLGHDKKFIDITKKNEKFILQQGDILVARIGSVGKSLCFESQEPSIFASYLIRLHFDRKKLVPKYLKYCFDSQPYWEQVKKLTSGAVQPQLNAPALRKIKIPLPPLSVQHEIVNEIEGYRKIIEGAKQVVQNWKPQIKIDQKWEYKNIEDICKNLDKMRIPLNETERSNKKGLIPYCGANGIIDYIDDFLFNETLLLIAEDGGFYGKNEPTTYIMKGKYWVNNHAHILKFDDEITLKYCHFILNLLDLNVYITGSTRKKLTLDKLKKIRFPIPNLEIQKQIVERIEEDQYIIQGNQKLIKNQTEEIQNLINAIWIKKH